MTKEKYSFDQALEDEGISGPLALVAKSIYAQESGSGRNTKTSNRGAVGGMQILPGTFKEVADSDWDIQDAGHNMRAGLRYLKKLDKLANGDMRLVAAGYYGGPGGLAKARNGVAVSDPKNPKNPTTLQYADQVLGRPGLEGVQGARAVAQAPASAPAPVSAVAAAPVVEEPQGAVAFTAPAQMAYATGPDPWAEFTARVAQATQAQEAQAAAQPAVPEVAPFRFASYAGVGAAPSGRVNFKAWTPRKVVL